MPLTIYVVMPYLVAMKECPITCRLNQWLRLIRIPNLFTVPGDVFAGFLLAGGAFSSDMIKALVVSMSLYMFGLVSNDLFDYREDARERSQRPLPAHAIPVYQAVVAALLLMGLGLGMAWSISAAVLRLAVMLSVVILVYNGGVKKIPVLGSVAMGGCRSLNVILGAFSVGAGVPHTVWVLAALEGAYICSVTLIAKDETRVCTVPVRRWLPAVCCIVVTFYVGRFAMLAIIPALCALLFAVDAGRRLGHDLSPDRTPRLIGVYIRNLILMQATFCMVAGWWAVPYSVLLVSMMPLARLIGRFFYAS